MIERNIVKFGYGDILVDFTYKGLRFREIDKAQPIGDADIEDLESGKVKLTGAALSVDIKNTEDLHNFVKCLEGARAGKTHVVWSTIILDFSNNNSTSIDMIEQVLESFRACVLTAWAC